MDLAVIHDQDAVVEIRLDAGQTGNRYNSFQTPLMRAAEHGQKRIVELLISQNDVDTGAVDGEGLDAMDYAKRYGHEGIAQMLDAAAARRYGY